MGMNMSPELQPIITQETRMEIKQSLDLKMSQDILDMGNQIYGKREDNLKSVIGNVIEKIPDEQIRKGMELMFSEENLIKEMVNNRFNLVLPTNKSVLRTIGDYVYNANEEYFKSALSENFDDKEKINTAEKESKQPFLTKADFDDALLKAEWVREENARLLDIYNSRKDDPAYKNIPQKILENEKALNFIESNKGQIETMSNALTYLLTLKNESGLPVVHDFIKEMAVLDKLNPVLSERIQKRFSARFSNIREKTKIDDYKIAFLNTIGEYTLAIMGIISPDLFDLKKGYLDKEEYEDLSKEMNNIGIDFKKMFSYYSLNGPGTIFVNRWKTIDIKPDRITDEKIRDFITKTVREDKDEIFAGLKFEDFFEEIKSIVLSPKTVEERQNMLIDLRRILQDKLSKKETKNFLVNLIKEKWYSKLDIFYKMQEKTENTSH